MTRMGTPRGIPVFMSERSIPMSKITRTLYMTQIPDAIGNFRVSTSMRAVLMPDIAHYTPHGRKLSTPPVGAHYLTHNLSEYLERRLEWLFHDTDDVFQYLWRLDIYPFLPTYFHRWKKALLLYPAKFKSTQMPGIWLYDDEHDEMLNFCRYGWESVLGKDFFPKVIAIQFKRLRRLK